MLGSRLRTIFDVLHAATNNRYADGDNVRLNNLGPIALVSNYNLTTSSGKILENISHSHIVSLMYILITSSRGSDDLSIGFNRDRNRRQRELTNKKNTKCKYHVTFMLKDFLFLPNTKEKVHTVSVTDS